MADKRTYLDQLADDIAALRAQLRIEIQQEMDRTRDRLVAEMQLEIDARRDDYRAFIDAAEARP